ncbi:MAG: MerR family transcriptional regulator [Bryobacteraceae bacterium]
MKDSAARNAASESKQAPVIPDKLYFRIGEASRLLGLPPHVLRYWETEFPSLAPKKSPGGQRLYRRKDLELLLMIKHLLYEQKFTIAGARQWLAQRSRRPKTSGPSGQGKLFQEPASLLEQIRRELAEIAEMLK